MASKGGMSVVYRFWWGNLRERDHLRNLGLCRRIILKMGMQETEWACAGLMWLIDIREGLLLRYE